MGREGEGGEVILCQMWGYVPVLHASVVHAVCIVVCGACCVHMYVWYTVCGFCVCDYYT